MKTRFTFTVKHHYKEDVDSWVEWTFSATNGQFSGEITVVSEPDLARQIAEKLRGFPKSLQDKRELRFQGTSYSRPAGEEARILLSHESINHGKGKCFMQSFFNNDLVSFTFDFTAAEVEDFVRRCGSFVVQEDAQLTFGATDIDIDTCQH